MGYKTWTVGEKVTAANMNAEVRDQVVSQVTSSTRPASPVEGMLISESDTNGFAAYSGAAWVPWGRWGALATSTPNLVQSSGVAKTVNHSVHFQIGKLVVFWFRMTVNVGSFGVAANAITVTLPVTAARADMLVGSGFVFDSSAGLGYSGSCYLADTGTIDFRQHGTGVATDNRLGVAGFTARLDPSDIVGGFAVYEAA